MHPRNIFRDVNFGDLAEKHSFFKGHVVQDPSTLKYNINFGNDDAVRALNRALLLEYYSLDVDIPLDCLIPRVPLRLNYILWIEDLLNHFKDQFPESKTFVGLDIGTGPCAIYALMGAKKNSNWIMHGSDINEKSIQSATSNVTKNNLGERVKLHQVTQGSYFSGVLKEEDSFDFSMCNPPFFSDIKDDLLSSNYPSIPWNVKSQIQEEIIFPGGEVSFVDGMIKESFEHPNSVKIFTTMIGVKKHLESLLKRLREYNCTNFTTCIFHQGRISRWGLAWSWDKSLDLVKLVSVKTNVRKSTHALESTFTNIPSFKSFVTQIVNVLKNLEMTVESPPNNTNACLVTAEKNTWSHNRRKRRMKLQASSTDPNEKVPLNSSSIKEDTDVPAVKTPRMDQGVQDCNNKTESHLSLHEGEIEPNTEKSKLENSHHNNTDGTASEPGLYFKLNMTRSSTNVVLQLNYLNGTFGKDGLHQVLQYLKNQSFSELK